MFDQDLSLGMRSLEGRAGVARLAIYVWAAFQLAGFAFQSYFLTSIAPDQSIVSLADSIDYATFGIFLLSAVAVSFWVHRAHENLRHFSSGPFEFSGQSAVFWFFVPFANLVQPFRAMRELWRVSGGSTDPSSSGTRLVDGWWACFIIGGLLSNIGARMLGAVSDDSSQLTALMVFDLGELLRLGSAVLLHEIIRAVGRMQAQRLSVGEVFD